MTRRAPKAITVSEWRIFSLLALGGPLPISAIRENLNRQHSNHMVTDSTIRELVRRLLAKGYLTTTSNGAPSSATVYGAGVPFETALRQHVNDFLDHFALAGAPDLQIIRDVVEERLREADPMSPLLDRIKIEPSRSVIRGTCVTVDSVLEQLAAGSTTEEILAHHSELSREDVLAAVAFARAALVRSIPPETRH